MIRIDGKNLLIRADASTKIGTGHVTRALAFSQYWVASGGKVAFLGQCPEHLLERLRENRITPRTSRSRPGSMEDARETVATACETNADWIFLDGYHFTPDYQNVLIQAGLKVLYLDDNGIHDNYPANLVLNQNLFASEELYVNRSDSTHLLLGTRFCLLRQEFQKYEDWRRETPENASNILITMGGSDNKNVTKQVLEFLIGFENENSRISVVIGGSNPHCEEIKSLAEKTNVAIEVLTDVKNMSQLMANADLAVASSGTTSWEMSRMGLPCVTVEIADNQSKIATAMATIGVTENLGFWNTVEQDTFIKVYDSLKSDRRRRSEMSSLGRHLVDGAGISRIIEAMISYEISETIAKKEKYHLREAVLSDIISIWNMANDPDVRRNSFNHESIPLENHSKWFRKKIVSPEAAIWILEDYGRVAGQIRYDKTDLHTAEIDISVSKSDRGQGLGNILLSETIKAVSSKLLISKLTATVFQNNPASAKVFIKNAFNKTESTELKGHAVDVYEFNY